MLSRPQHLGHPAANLQTVPLGEAARGAHARIVELLRQMVRCDARSPLDPSFLAMHRALLGLIASFQQRVLEGERRTPSCSRGCAACCMHWVEDVNSFEALILADHLRRTMPDRIAGIVSACRADQEAMVRLDEAVYDAMRRSADERQREKAEFDHVDLLLASFYRLRRPCPLLDSDGACMVYDLRPVTCRIYVSFSPPARCDPDYAVDHDIPTVLLDLEEDANALLDTLHARFDTLDNDTSLRTQLLGLLQAPVS